MRCNHLPGDYNGGPSLTEWLSQIWKAVKSIIENGVKNPHKLTFTGDVEAEYDGSKDVTVDISGGGGGGGESDKLWYPYIVEKVLKWRKTTSTTTPTPFDLNQLKGDPGTNGTNGEDGFSPSASVKQTSTGATITITDKTGTTTADIKNGADGATGAAAGFGTVDATATTGTAAGATVTTDGPDTAKNMHFAFTIPSGGGGGTGDVTAAGNNTFSGANKFTGRVDFESNVHLGDKTHVSTPTSNENATNKLYVDTLADTTQSTAETNAKNYTDEKIAGSIGVGDTTTLEPGNNATVTETVVGGVHKFSFGIPKGEKGADGADGAKGDTGPAGPYTDIEIGTVTTGEPGTDAEASFDTATPGMALLDLKIPRGNPGADGSTGPAGPAGPAGPEGPKGQTGETGPAGAPGAAAGFGTVDATATTGTTAGATVTTDGPDTAKNMHFAFTIPTGGGGGGGDNPTVYKISSATLTGDSLASQRVEAQVVQIGKQLIIRGYIFAVAQSSIAGITGIDLKFSSRVPSLPSASSPLRFNSAGFYVSESKVSNTYELTIDKFGNEYLLTFSRGSSSYNLTTNSDGEQGFFYMVVFLE